MPRYYSPAVTMNSDKWMDGWLAILLLISERWKGDNEKLGTIKIRLCLKRFPPPGGSPITQWVKRWPTDLAVPVSISA